jgi:hypothetical protein
LVCKEELEYKELETKKCFYCNGEFETSVSCSNGHFVCDNCHKESSLEFLKSFIQNTHIKDPVVMANKIMNHPTYNMHGPEHHYLIPSVVLKSIENNGYDVPPNYWNLVLARCSDLPGGTCGYWGACSSNIGAGIAASIYSKSHPLDNKNYGKIHDFTARSMNEVVKYGGPRCCKRNSFLSLESTLDSFKEFFDVNIEHRKAVCTFYESNNECLETVCPYYPEHLKGEKNSD